MTSALGRTMRQSCAAARAGLDRARAREESVFAIAEGDLLPVIGHGADPITAGFAGPGRLAVLVCSAIEDLRSQIGSALRGRRVQTLMVVPDHRHELRQIEVETAALGELRAAVREYRRARVEDSMADEERAIEAILAQALHSIGAKRVGVGGVVRGAAGFAAALQAIGAALDTGAADECLLVACDSLLDAETIEALQALDLLKCAEHPVGLLPGEAAVVLAIGSANGSGALPCLGVVEDCILDAAALAPPTNQEGDHPASENGAMSEPDPMDSSRCLARILTSIPNDPAESVQVFADLNGEEVRARCWGGLMAMPGWPPAAETCIPAIAFGDTGSAAGAVATAMAVHGWQRSSAVSGRGLVVLTGEDRAVIQVRRPTPVASQIRGGRR